jgi:hypothetical protein
MERIVLFRLLLYIFSFVGLILCVVSLVLPYWITFSTPAISGHQGLFFTCIYQHGGDKHCSEILDSNVNGK